MPQNQRVAKAIAEIRSKLGLSQNQFAVKFGINVSTLRAWEQGINEPDLASLATLLRIAGRQSVLILRAMGLTDQEIAIMCAGLTRGGIVRSGCADPATEQEEPK